MRARKGSGSTIFFGGTARRCFMNSCATCRPTEYFRTSEPMASVAVIGHPGSSGTDLQMQQSTQQGQGELIALLDTLGAWNIQYEVLFEDRLAQLGRYPVAVGAEPEHTPVGTAAALDAFT